jgi:hypothetical protein
MSQHDAHIDGCDIDMSEDPLEEGTEDLFVLFAEALDPDTELTVEQAKAEWEELFS